MRFLALLILLLPTITNACDSINLGLISHHWDRAQGYNERHSGIGCTNALGRWDVLYFHNSNRRDSLFVGDYKPLFHVGRLTAGFDYGLVTGYGEWVATPIILPRFQYDAGRVRLNTYILFTEGLAFGLEFDI